MNLYKHHKLSDFLVDSDSATDVKASIEDLRFKKKSQKSYYKKRIFDFETRLEEAEAINNELEKNNNQLTAQFGGYKKDLQTKLLNMDKYSRELKEDYIEKISDLNNTISDLKSGFSHSDSLAIKRLIHELDKMVYFWLLKLIHNFF